MLSFQPHGMWTLKIIGDKRYWSCLTGCGPIVQAYPSKILTLRYSCLTAPLPLSVRGTPLLYLQNSKAEQSWITYVATQKKTAVLKYLRRWKFDVVARHTKRAVDAICATTFWIGLWHNRLLDEASLVLRHFHVDLNNLVIISQHTSQPFCKPNISGVISTHLNTICQPVPCRFTQPYQIIEISPNSQPQWCK